jgi:hypothetical protein
MFQSGVRELRALSQRALGIEFSNDDLDLLNNVITVVPILRIVAAIGKKARQRGLRYPVASVADLTACLGKTTLHT